MKSARRCKLVVVGLCVALSHGAVGDEKRVSPRVREWVARAEAIERMLLDAEWQRALTESDAVLDEMGRMLVSRGSELIGGLLLERAVAQQGLGEDVAAQWDAWAAAALWRGAETALQRYGGQGAALREALAQHDEPSDLDEVADSGLGLLALSTSEPTGESSGVGKEVTAPKKLSAPPPKYPEGLRQARVEDLVEVEVVIDVAGRPHRPRVVSGVLHPTLVLNTLEAIRDWRFEPGEIEGEPIEVLYSLTVNFAM